MNSDWYIVYIQCEQFPEATLPRAPPWGISTNSITTVGEHGHGLTDLRRPAQQVGSSASATPLRFCLSSHRCREEAKVRHPLPVSVLPDPSFRRYSRLVKVGCWACVRLIAHCFFPGLLSWGFVPLTAEETAASFPLFLAQISWCFFGQICCLVALLSAEMLLDGKIRLVVGGSQPGPHWLEAQIWGLFLLAAALYVVWSHFFFQYSINWIEQSAPSDGLFRLRNLTLVPPKFATLIILHAIRRGKGAIPMLSRRALSALWTGRRWQCNWTTDVNNGGFFYS
jgi:hypothetical protein